MRRGAAAWLTLTFFAFLAGGAVVAVNSPDWAATVDHALTAWHATPTPQPTATPMPQPTPQTRVAATLAATRGGDGGAVRWLVGGLLMAAVLLALTAWLLRRANPPAAMPSPTAPHAAQPNTPPDTEAEVLGVLRWA